VSSPAVEGAPGGAQVAAEQVARRNASFVELTKPRLNLLVLLTTLAGYYVGAGSMGPGWHLAFTLVGTALVAAGASALNQWMERDLDSLMHRTRSRPLPSGRLTAGEGLAFGVTLAVAGVALLAVTVNLLTAGLAALTCLAYLFFYTPLKRLTPLNTLVGAVPGAIPPVMGWAAARNGLGPEAAVLFAILFFWQMPHFLAIAWLHREDYARGGCRMLPLEERGEARTGLAAVLYAAALVPAALAPFLLSMAGPVYLAVAAILSAGFLAAAVNLAGRRTEGAARILFRSSLIFLPVLFVLMSLDKVAG
jgi:protoheme IX farnesyltransferase